MIIKYVNSIGKELVLNSKELRIKEANFHNYAWRYSYKEKNNGIYVSEFSKREAQYPMVLCAFGSLDERKKIFNAFLDVTEYDVARNVPGKLWYGEWYLECFVIESSTTPNKNYYTEREIMIMGPSNEWVKETKKTFLGRTNTQTASETSNADYPRDYSYDYESKFLKETIVNEGYTAEDFKMTIYGPVINPSVVIGKNLYQIYTEVKESEYLVVDTQNTITAQYDKYGNATPKWNSRNKNYQIYEKIPLGINDVIWQGDFGFDIVTYEKRSEPRWNLS